MKRMINRRAKRFLLCMITMLLVLSVFSSAALAVEKPSESATNADSSPADYQAILDAMEDSQPNESEPDTGHSAKIC